MLKQPVKNKRKAWSSFGSEYPNWHPFEYLKLDPELLDWHPALAYNPRDAMEREIDSKLAMKLISRELDKWPLPLKKTMKDWIELDNISQAARLNGVSRAVFTNKLKKLVKTVREEMQL